MKTSTMGLLFLTVLSVVIIEQVIATAIDMMPEQCDPEILSQVDVSPKIKKICNFLQAYAAIQQNREGFLANFPAGMIENGVKRQDVDHVFLRFGRRR